MIVETMRATDRRLATMVTSQWCPIGSLGLHTYNWEQDECIWCGPGHLAWSEGRWVRVEKEDSSEHYVFDAWTTWGPLTQKQIEDSRRS